MWPVKYRESEGGFLRPPPSPSDCCEGTQLCLDVPEHGSLPGSPPQAVCEELSRSHPCPPRTAALYKACLQVLKPSLSQQCFKHREGCSLTTRALGRLRAKAESCCTYHNPTGSAEELRSHKHACCSPMLMCSQVHTARAHQLPGHVRPTCTCLSQLTSPLPELCCCCATAPSDFS